MELEVTVLELVLVLRGTLSLEVIFTVLVFGGGCLILVSNGPDLVELSLLVDGEELSTTLDGGKLDVFSERVYILEVELFVLILGESGLILVLYGQVEQGGMIKVDPVNVVP